MQWFRNLDARPRLMISFGVLILLTMGIGYLSIKGLSDSNDRFETLATRDMPAAQKSNDLAKERLLLSTLAREAILHAEEPAVVADNEGRMLQAFSRLHGDLDEMGKYYFTPAGKEIVAGLHSNLPPYEQAYHDVFARLHGRDVPGAMAILKQTAPLEDSMTVLSERAVQQKVKRGQINFEENKQAFGVARTLIVSGGVLSLAVGLLLAYFISEGFAVPLRAAVLALESLAQGDLTFQLKIGSKDEVGRMGEALNKAVARLNEALEEVADNASQATHSSEQLASAAESLALGAQRQAASLEETSASLEEITATVRQSADNAHQADQLASGSRDAAEKGLGVVSSAITAMTEINAASAKISDIISTIDEIAFQTNLLAVNAAVEAARAGEEGRGFAVVATEVRSLAQRSSGAAKEIKGLIEDSLKRVETGSDLVNKSGETLEGIVSSIKRVTGIFGEIAASASEQSIGVEQVNTAVTQMDQVTQSNSAQTVELSATAQSLSEQAVHLMQLVSAFTLRRKPGGSLSHVRLDSAANGAPSAALQPKRHRGAKSRNGAATRTSKPNTVRQRVPVPTTAGVPDDASFDEFGMNDSALV